MDIVTRFLKYVDIDTQSNPDSTTYPSTAKQFNLAKVLVEDMKAIGIEDAEYDEFGVVYGHIPSNGKEGSFGFISHMDVSYEAKSYPIHPQIISNYDGNIIPLSEGKVLDPAKYPALKKVVGDDLITTDGTTLLGADDKAGISIILDFCQYMYEHPEFIHPNISVAFTPDEEIGAGTDHFDIQKFNAEYGYTIDGGDIHEIENENFNAYSAKVTVTGKGIHPGDAKDRMINAIRVANQFDALLPEAMRPEHTEGYEGFIHLHTILGGIEETKMEYILRDHNYAKVKHQIELLDHAKDYINTLYGYECISIEYKEQYRNMKEIIDQYPYIIERVENAMKKNHQEYEFIAMRGGTDGAMLSYKGLPCPNLGTGGFNYHSNDEYVSITQMKKQVELLKYMAGE